MPEEEQGIPHSDNPPAVPAAIPWWHKDRPHWALVTAVIAVLGLIAAVAFGIWSNSSKSNPPVGPATTKPEDTASPPFTYTVEQHLSGVCGTYLFRQTVDELGPPPTKATPWSQWVSEHDGIDVGTAKILLNIRGKTDVPVTITSLEIDAVERRAGGFTGGTLVNGSQCGGPASGRLVLFDLDRDPAEIVSSQADPNGQWADPDSPANPPIRTVPLEFPYKITDTDSELLLVYNKTKNNYVEFRLRLGWTNGTRSGIQNIDNAGEPFVATVVRKDESGCCTGLDPAERGLSPRSPNRRRPLGLQRSSLDDARN